jgi:hypothetical protein
MELYAEIASLKASRHEWKHRWAWLHKAMSVTRSERERALEAKLARVTTAANAVIEAKRKMQEAPSRDPVLIAERSIRLVGTISALQKTIDGLGDEVGS